MTDSVLPGNPGSDWTEQDEQRLHSYATYSPYFPRERWGGIEYAHRFAREILRLRGENERQVTELHESMAQQYRETESLRAELASKRHISRWNIIENADRSLSICKGDHERSAGCDFEDYAKERNRG